MNASAPPGPAAGDAPPSRRQLLVRVTVITVVLAVLAWTIGLLVSAACGPSCTGAATPGPPASPVDGVVIGVDSAGLGQVRGFTLRATSSPFPFTLRLGPLENAAEFSPSHLAEHLASSEPIRAWYRLENGVPVVYRLEDAPG